DRSISWDTNSAEIIAELPAGINSNFDVHWHPKLPGVISASLFHGKVGIYNIEACARYIVETLKAPKWHQRKAGVLFGFGGKLVAFHTIGPSYKASEVDVHDLVTEHSIGSSSSEFEAAMRNAQLTRFREAVTVTIQNAIVVALSGPAGDVMRRNDEGTSMGRQPQFTRMTKIEFSKFGGDDVRGWLYKCKQFFEIDHVSDPHKVQLASIHLYDTTILWHRQFVKLMSESASWNSFKEVIMQRFDLVHDYSNDNVIDHDEEVVHEEVTGEVIEFTPQISLNALNGVESFQTLRVTGHVGKQDLHILIDTGKGIPNSIASLLTHFHDVFAIPTSLPPMREYDYKIVLKKGTEPIFSKPYRHPPAQKDAFDIMVKELLESGVIRPSQSPFSSPVVMVK
nr:WD40/YVTN repeat-like-containing domain, ancestral coatomer element 1, Sec16/Sec31 [Tanacetum cinerariifolium]